MQHAREVGARGDKGDVSSPHQEPLALVYRQVTRLASALIIVTSTDANALRLRGVGRERQHAHEQEQYQLRPWRHGRKSRCPHPG
jgi:hypothetical protein